MDARMDIGSIFHRMICYTFVMVLVALMCLVGRSGHMVGADQLLITDRLIASVQQASTPPLHPQMNALPINGDSQDFNDVADVVTELHNSLRFEPSKLDFGTWSIGMARSHTVTLVNQNENKSVYLSSVSGKTSAFYSSFFEAKMVPPQGNTTFNVVFLPRANGAVTTNLLIHTSFGQAKLLVSGEGRECPYRLKPILGIKAPLNATLTQGVLMYNPHNHPLQILEVYSSGGQFQLELPSGGKEGPKTLWEIPPYATKPVIRIRFKGNQSGNHTAFIRIKLADNLNSSVQTNENVIVIPAEFEILPHQGIYTEIPVIDFQRLTTHDKLIRKQIELKDSINSLDLKSQDVVVDYVLSDIPGLTFSMKEAIITLDPQKFVHNTRLEELLVIKTIAQHNNSVTQEFSVLIRAEVFKGSLTFDKNATIFVTKSENYVTNEPRWLVVSNQFSMPLTILNVSVEHNDSSVILIVKSDSFSPILQPDESMKLVKLQIVDEAAANFKTTLHIHTNVTSISIPVIVCAGTLHVQTIDSSQDFSFGDYNTDLSLGIVPYAEMSHAGFIVLQNRNPLSIKLSSWDFKTPQGVHFHTTFIGCVRESVVKTLKEYDKLMLDTSKFKFCTHLEEYDVAAFQIAIKSYITDGSMGSLKIWTPFEVITAQVSFLTWIGKLEVEQQQVYFKSCFPGKLCSSDLSIRSTFLKPIHISSINFTDNGITFQDFNDKGTWIAPETTTKVGRIYFEPAKICEKRCYIPQNDDKANDVVFAALKRGRPQVKGNNNNHYFDETELRRRTELFRHLKWYFQTISFTLNSNEIRQFQLYLIIDIEWPKLVSGKQTLPTIEVGKKQIMQLNVTNPDNRPILIEYFLSDPKYSKDTQLSLPLEVVDICTNCYLTDKDVFSLPDYASRKPLLVPAGSSVTINVQFSAKEADNYSTLLHIRNNLTLYEAVWLTAKTVQSQFKFGNRKPGSSTPLLFEVNEKHLSACTNSDNNRKSRKDDQLTIVTKRIFTARNTGEIPIWIETFMIDDQICEGFGFKVLDCKSFVLQANSSKKIEIAFSPDFTSSRISRPLRLIANLSFDVNYLLVAVLPPVSLDMCSEMLPRPIWEVRYKLVTLMIVGTTFIFVMVAAHIDYANLLIKQTDLFMSREKGPVQPTFNLRNIAIKSQTQISGGVCNDHQHPSTQSIQKSTKPQNKNSAINRSSINNNSSNLKKRGVKKVNSNGSGGGGVGGGKNISLSEIAWPIELTAPKGEKGMEKVPISMQNFTEHSFPLKLEADKTAGGQSPSNSSTSISSCESSVKSSPPKQSKRTQRDAPNVVSPGSKKQKNLRKSKKLVHTISNENSEKETTPKATNNRSPKQTSKLIPEATVSISNNEKSMDSELMEPTVSGCVSKQNNQGLNDANGGGGRKYGRTPGRERKKELTNAAAFDGNNTPVRSKRSDRKKRNKVANALNFNSSPIRADINDMNTFNSILPPPPWNTSNQVAASFSHVLQLQQMPTNNSDSGNFIKSFGLETLEQSSVSNNTISQDSNSLLMSNDLETEVFNAHKKIEHSNSTELGPIGSKKSPSSTPVWEPLCAISTTNTPTVSKPTLSQNSSFFSNLLPSSYGYNDNQNQQLVIDLTQSGLYELKKAQEELHRQWQASEYLFNLRQQQMLSQQQQLQTVDATNNWAVPSQTWTPMNYGQNVLNNSPSPGNNTGVTLNPWQRTTSIRPPPGLEQNFQTNGLSTGPRHQMQVPAVNDNATAGVAPPAAAAATENLQTIHSFDPFSSLSSIWSENWNKNHRNDLN